MTKNFMNQVCVTIIDVLIEFIENLKFIQKFNFKIVKFNDVPSYFKIRDHYNFYELSS